MEIKYDEYDKIVDMLEDCVNNNPEWLPSIDEIKKYMEPHIDTFIYFIIWLIETSKQTEQNIDSWRYLNNLLKQHLVFIE